MFFVVFTIIGQKALEEKPGFPSLVSMFKCILYMYARFEKDPKKLNRALHPKQEMFEMNFPSQPLDPIHAAGSPSTVPDRSTALASMPCDASLRWGRSRGGLKSWSLFGWFLDPTGTPLKFNIAPENRQSQRKLIFQPPFFRGYVKFRGCNWEKTFVTWSFSKKTRGKKKHDWSYVVVKAG